MGSGAVLDHGIDVSRAQRQGLLGGATVTMLAESLALPAGIIIAGSLTRGLGPEIYGRFIVVATALGIAEWLLIAVFARAVVKFVAEADHWEGVGATAVRVYLATGALIGASFWIGADAFAALLKDPSLAELLQAFAPQIPIFAVSAAARNILAGRGRFQQQAYASAAAWTGRVVFIVGFVALGWGVHGAILGSICGTATGAIVSLLMVGPGLWTRPTLPVRKLVQLAVPVFVSMVSVRLLDQIGVFVLEAVGRQPEDVGFYGAAMNVFIVTTIVGAGMTPVLISSLSAARMAGGREAVQPLVAGASRFGVSLFPLAAIVAGAAGELAVFVFGEAFVPTGPLLSILVIAAFVRANISILSAVLIGLDRAWLVAAVAAPLPLIALLGHVFMVPEGGATAAALVTLGASLLGGLAFLAATTVTGVFVVPWPTVGRAAVLTAVAFGLASSIPAPGAWVLLKTGVLTAAVAGAFVVTGELSPAELARLRGAGPR